MNPNQASEKLSAAIKDAEAQLRSRIAAEIARVRVEHAVLDPDHASQFEAGMLWMGAFITGIQDYDLQHEVEILAAREVQTTTTDHDAHCPSCHRPILLGQGNLGGCPMRHWPVDEPFPATGSYTVTASGTTFDRAEYWFATEQEARDAYTDCVNAGCAVTLHGPTGTLIQQS